MVKTHAVLPLLAALLSSVSQPPALAQSAATAFPLGVYVANPNGNDTAAQQYFETSYNAFVKVMGGAHPSFFNSFTDFSQDPSQWAANASWSAWSSNLTGAGYVGSASGAIPVVGVPLASTQNNNAEGFGNVDLSYQDILAGKYDAAYQGIVDAWANQGYKVVEFRNCWEFDGPFMPCDPANSSKANANADFVAAFQHVAAIEHSRATADGIVAKVEWNPDTINWTAYDVTTVYPGDAYVDVISADIYSPVYPNDLTNWADGGKEQLANLATWSADPANRAHFWQYQNGSQWNPTPALGSSGWSFQNAVDFAKLHHKPMAIDESGAGPAIQNGITSTVNGPADDPNFVKWLHDALAAAQASGVTVDHVDIWDATMSDGDWNFSNGSKPLEAAAYTQYFGAGSGTGTSISSSAWYEIINQTSNDCADAKGWGTTSGTPVQQWTCGGKQYNQGWQFQPTDNGYFKIANRGASFQVLDVSGQGTTNGTAVQLWQDNGGTNQQWMPVSSGNGTYKFVGRGSNRCLDVPGASTSNGAALQIYDCNGTGAQVFVLTQQP